MIYVMESPPLANGKTTLYSFWFVANTISLAGINNSILPETGDGRQVLVNK